MRNAELLKLAGCRCRPCPVCGYKHYCNLTLDHTGHRVRLGDCPGNESWNTRAERKARRGGRR